MRKYYNGEGNEIIGYDVTITKSNRAQPYFVIGFEPWEHDESERVFEMLYKHKLDVEIVELYEIVKEGKGDDTEVVYYVLANCISPSDEP